MANTKKGGKKRIVVGNWKMYITSPDAVKKFVSTLKRKSQLFSGVEVAIAPPYTLLPVVAAAFKNSTIKVVGQSVSEFTDDKRTGEVSATMLKQSGAQMVLVGHSERRAMGDTNEVVHTQLKNVLEQGLVAVLCIGETERDSVGAYLTNIEEQLGSALSNLPLVKSGKLMVAYEPVWAIGKTAQGAMRPADVREMSIFIKKTIAQHMERAAALKVPILYGGSVEADNAAQLIKEGDVQGLLVGHASSEVESFLGILKAVKN